MLQQQTEMYRKVQTQILEAMTDQEIIERYQEFEKLVRDYRASERAYQKEHRRGPADHIKAKMKELAALVDAWSLKPKAPKGEQVGMF